MILAEYGNTSKPHSTVRNASPRLACNLGGSARVVDVRVCVHMCVWHRVIVVSFVLLWLYMFVWCLAAVWSRPLARVIPVMRLRFGQWETDLE